MKEVKRIKILWVLTMLYLSVFNTCISIRFTTTLKHISDVGIDSAGIFNSKWSWTKITWFLIFFFFWKRSEIMNYRISKPMSFLAHLILWYFCFRTRDPALLDTCDIVVDVGGVYDPAKNRFDHHQRQVLSRNKELLSFNLPW